MSQLEGYFVVEYEAILHCKDDARKEPVFWCLLSCHPSCMVVTYRGCFENESSACQETSVKLGSHVIWSHSLNTNTDDSLYMTPTPFGSLHNYHLIRACPPPLGRSTILITPPLMGSPHNLPNSRGLSAHGLHILLNPDRRPHHHFLEEVAIR